MCSDHSERVAFIEPRCHGLEHVPFNAALVAAVLAARPTAMVDVYGERSHLDEVRQLLTATRGANIDRLAWRPVEVPPRRAAGWNRATQVRRMFATIDDGFRTSHPKGVVVATADPLVLVLVKSRLFAGWSGVPVLAVFHELLATLERRWRSTSRWEFAASLSLPHPRGLTYLVLAESILSSLRQIAPSTAEQTVAIDHPSLLADLPASGERRGVPPLRFGFVGGGRDAKGFHEFLEIVRGVRQCHSTIDFEVVGSAPADMPAKALAQLTWSDRKLPLGEFVERLRALSHIVWLGDPAHYRLVASGSLADAISLGIPVICRSGSFVNHLFERFGEIGVKCDTLSEVQEQVMSIAGHFSPETYARQVEAGCTAAKALTPEACAPVLERALRGA